MPSDTIQDRIEELIDTITTRYETENLPSGFLEMFKNFRSNNITIEDWNSLVIQLRTAISYSNTSKEIVEDILNLLDDFDDYIAENYYSKTASDAKYVALSGAQTITGGKTFNVLQKYVDDFTDLGNDAPDESIPPKGYVDRKTTEALSTGLKTIEGISLIKEGDSLEDTNIDLTKSMVGLGNVDNTSDLNKPISTATQHALDVIDAKIDTHTGNTSNPHSVTKSQVGLGNVDNTSDLNKPISTATQAALDDKVDKTGLKTIEGQSLLGTGNIDLSKEAVGLGNVDNTSDANKPVSTAQQAALDLKADKSTTYNKTEVDDKETGLQNQINTIDGKIPSQASSSNKLADKDYVNDQINSVAAYYITRNAQGDAFESVSQLEAVTTFYSGGVERVPTRNDYCIVRVDETHDDATTRYIYTNQWEYQYTVNETPLTSAQIAAINSGITSSLVTQIGTNQTNITNLGNTKQDNLVSGTNIKTVAGNSLVGSGDVVLSKSDVGLGNVDNTSDLNKPISTATQTALDTKQATLVSGTNIKTIEGQSILGEGNIDLGKSDVGLGNVDNTSDADKPISTATQTALNAKQATLESGTNIKSVANKSILGSGNLPLYTSDILTSDQDSTPLSTILSGKQNTIDSTHKLDADLVNDSTSDHKFVTTSDKTTWNSKQDALVPGTNIQIAADGKTISATDTTYTNGTGIVLTGNAFSVDSTHVALQNDIASLVAGVSYTVNGTSAYFTVTPHVGNASTFTLPLANGTDAGLMSPSDVATLATLAAKVTVLEGVVHKLLYTTKPNPTANEILAFVNASGYTDINDYYGIKVVVEDTNHVWIWYDNLSQFQDIGLETVLQFTNSSAGSILGSNTIGKVYAENDGTGSVVGWDNLNNMIAPAYDATNTYNVGDLVRYNGILYRCSTAITVAEAWDSTHWVQTSLALYKLDKTTQSYKVYSTDASGNQILITYSKTATADNLVQRDGTQIKVPLTPVANDDASSKKYIDDGLANKVNTSDFNKRINGLAETNDAIRQLDYDEISVVGLTSDTTFTLKAAPTVTDAGMSCIPIYKAIVTNNANSTIYITLPVGTAIRSNDSAVTISSNTFAMASGLTLEMTIYNNGAELINKAKSYLNADTTDLSNFYNKTQSDNNYQPKDADLTAIAGLSGTSGLLKKTAADTWALDTNTYLTTSDKAADSDKLDGNDSSYFYAASNPSGYQANVLEGVQINGTDLAISSKKINLVTKTAYNSSTNKLATESDIPTKVSDLSNDSGFTTNTGTVIGSSLTADTIVLGNGTVNIKASTYKPASSSTTWDDSSDVYLPSMKAIKTYIIGKGYTTNTGTVTSITVKTGTGLTGGSDTAATTTGTWTINIASGYKLPTDTEWSTVTGNISTIEGKIPSQASTSNQLADKAFVNSSVSTATATFRGTFTNLTDLQATTGDMNDYAFYSHTDSAGNTVYDRYKYTSETPHWVYEYTLNNSSFTSDQWATINSGITSSNYVPSTRTVNSKALSSNISLDASDVGAVASNTAITGATKTKITYDSKGLVTAGADLADTDIPSLDASKITSGTFADSRISSASTWNAKYAKPSGGIPSTDLAEKYVRVDTASQNLSSTEQANARTNIGAGTSSFSGSYNDLTDKPTIPTVPTKTSDLTNDSGFLTSHQAIKTINGNTIAGSSGNINIDELGYSTTEPSVANTNGRLKIIVLNAEPTDYLEGYLYIILESQS